MADFDIPDIIKEWAGDTSTAEPIGEDNGVVFYYFFCKRGFASAFLGPPSVFAYKDGKIIRKYYGKVADELAERLAPERMCKCRKDVLLEYVGTDDLDEIQDWFMMEGLPMGEAAVQRLLDGEGTGEDEKRLREAIMDGKADRVRWDGGIVVE